MAKFNSIQVYEKMRAKRVLPLFNYADAEICKSVMRACYNAGVRVFELTNRDEAAYNVFKQLVPFVENELPDLSLGAGTIMDAETAQRFIDTGADFIIAPNLEPLVGEVCVKNKVPWIPGCFSPSEMKTAYDLGAELIKLFPAGSLGPAYLKHLKGPLPFLKIIVTGGVDLDETSLKSWLGADVFAIGLGS
ncbi:MAG: bifunctional 4-hydroxy-2-oxoglutarate aldolase/2-dehydro-3-deoxy-phosphogluconate aldolase, partial [Chitinophagaceae bacterium]